MCKSKIVQRYEKNGKRSLFGEEYVFFVSGMNILNFDVTKGFVVWVVVLLARLVDFDVK